MRDRLRVAIVDDHPLFRDGVTQGLNRDPEIAIVGEGSSAADALQLAADLLPDILLLDISIPGGGLAAVRTLTMQCPVVKIVMLTGSERQDDLVVSLKSGARAYVLKGVSARELAGIIKGVAAGEAYVTPALAAGLLMEMTRPGQPAAPTQDVFAGLSEREHEILQLVAAGRSNGEIGLKLHLSEKTIKHYMTNILQKLQVRNRVEAAILAQREVWPERRV